MLVILSGVSGAGKDTIKKELIKRMENVISLPSFTSRGPRPGEEEGVQYHFITKEEFIEKINNGEFYEYDLHHENFYGTSKKLMNEKIESGKIIVKDIEVNGTENLIKLLKNETRLDNLSEADMQLRLDRLDYEESKINLYDYVIKNDDLEKTVQVIMTIIENEKRIEDNK